jgi:tetratricopeptide (TPR) repeat protein
MSSWDPDKLSSCGFGEYLGFLLLVEGARPPGAKKKQGERWTKKEFAAVLAIHERTVGDWLRGKKTPVYLHDIEKALFDPADQAEPRRIVLRQAHQRSRQKETKEGGAATAERGAAQSEAEAPANGVGVSQILHPEIREMRDFTGRGELLDAIGAALWRKGGAAALTDTGAGRASNSGAAQAAVRGMGGVGKSVLAREYGWRNHAAYRGVWWVRAETETTAIDDLIELGSRLVPDLAEVQERDRALHLALDAITQAGADGKPWLIVYDNAESPAGLARLTPATSAHALITSRWPDWHGHAEELPVDVFPPEIAVDYLLAHTRHPDRDAAARLAEALGRLPLALAHARATCWRYNWSFDAYRAKLPELIRKELAKPDDKAIVYATFDLAIAKVAETHPAAEQLMGLAAFLAPDRIPLDLFTADVMSEEDRDDALAALADVSLIEHETLTDGARAFTVHRLVQEVMRSRLNDDRQLFRQIALNMVLSALNVVNVKEHVNWPHVALFLPHAVTLLNSLDAQNVVGAGELCSLLALYLGARGDFMTATPYAEWALAIAEAALGPDHSNTSTSLNNLAWLYHSQGRYQDAEPLYTRAIGIAESALGPNHPDTGARLSNLATLYQAQARYKDAEPLYARALAIAETALGHHPDTGIRLNNLAVLYQTKGHYAEAELLYARAVAIAETTLGPDHPDTGARLSNLAELYRAQGRHLDAEPLCARALAIAEAALGPDHPDTGTRLNNLTLLYQAQGRYQDAEQFCARALAIAETALGPDHPDTGMRVNNLAELYRAQGRHQDAEPLYVRAIAIAEAALGDDHPTTGISLNNLALLYHGQGCYSDAEPLYVRALAIAQTTLGDDHPDTGMRLNNLAELYRAQGRYRDAEPLCARALAITETALGPNHPNTGMSLNNLALLYEAQGRYAEAEPLFVRAIATAEAALGPDHPDTGMRLNNLAELYRTQGRDQDAEPLYARALAIVEAALGPDHSDTGVTLNNLAALREDQGRHAEAEPLYLRALAILEARLGPDHPHTKIAKRNYERFLAEKTERERGGR